MASAPLVDEAVISVVNFNPVWGDLDANLAQMLEYIDQAVEAGTNILVFPEMALNGYCSSSDPTNEKYRLAVDTAITTDSIYAQTILEAAVENNMYIIFGASEEIPEEEKGDSDQAYNSAFCCCPNGEIVTYRKIQPVEGSWCRAGDTPVVVETPYGALGLSICKDTYSYPELSRYYVAKGCTYIVNPTATSRGGQFRWSWYYDTRLESLCDRDKIVVVSADLCGSEYNADGNLLYTFPGGSCVLADLNRASDGSYVSYVAGTGEYEPTAVGMYTGTLDLTDARYNITYGCSISFFNPALYSSWYSSLTTSTSSSVAAISGTYEFSDVSYGRWSAPYVYDLYTSGVVNGYGDGTFLPEGEVTRAAFVKMLACVSGADVTQYTASAFSDVAENDWFAPYVAWAAETGITVGTSETTFSPNVSISRQDMAVMLVRFAAAEGIDLTATLDPITFLDAADIRSYAADAVSALQAADVLHGFETEGGYVFQPLASTTREQAAALLSQLTA
jgi:predicted amidohydrolase